MLQQTQQVAGNAQLLLAAVRRTFQVRDVPLAGEGAMQAVSQKTGIVFPRVKVGFDTSMVSISGITCLFVLHGFGSVGAGTIISAILVGTVLSFIMKLFRERFDEFLNDDSELICYEREM